METYIPLVVARSDGKHYDVAQVEHAHKEDDRTQPTEPDGEQATRWKATIGSHLKYQLAPPDDNRSYILRDFPDGYELRIHQKKDKVHPYLYGHPKDGRARYRTPAEFVPHVLWLISESTDRNDCSCQFCVDMCASSGPSAAGGRGETPRAAAQHQTGENPGLPGAPHGVPQQQQKQQQQQPQQQQQQRPQPLQEPSRPPSGGLPQGFAPQLPPAAAGSQNRATSAAQPPAASPARPLPGIIGMASVFRVGELVWYKHMAWRLGIILGIAPKNAQAPARDDESSYRFVLAPLGHALIDQPNVLKEASEMRPFLTFSVPDTTVPELQGRGFDDVKWAEFVERARRAPDDARRARELQIYGLEASKMAARSINATFSTFNRLAGPAVATRHGDGSATYTTHYGGVYLGAEMIVLGDPIRVAAPAGGPADARSVVLLVQEILLASTDADPTPVLYFRGDVYALRLVPRDSSSSTDDADANADAAQGRLGPACREEIVFRNNLSAAGSGGDAQQQQQRWTWTLVERGAARAEGDVQGRFYVTHRLMRVIDPARLAEAVRLRTLEDAQAYLNHRMHQAGVGRGAKHTTRRPSRADAIGSAVCARVVLPDGLVEEDGEAGAPAAAGPSSSL